MHISIHTHTHTWLLKLCLHFYFPLEYSEEMVFSFFLVAIAAYSFVWNVMCPRNNITLLCIQNYYVFFQFMKWKKTRGLGWRAYKVLRVNIYLETWCMEWGDKEWSWLSKFDLIPCRPSNPFWLCFLGKWVEVTVYVLWQAVVTIPGGKTYSRLCTYGT